MMSLFNSNGIHTRDTFRFYKEISPITYGEKDPETGMMETVLTHVEDQGSRQSLDYIFECFYDHEIKDHLIEDDRDRNNNSTPAELPNGGNFILFNLK